MGLKYTVETIGELRQIIKNLPDDCPFEIRVEKDNDWTFQKFEVQSFYDNEKEMFVRFEPTLT